MGEGRCFAFIGWGVSSDLELEVWSMLWLKDCGGSGDIGCFVVYLR